MRSTCGTQYPVWRGGNCCCDGSDDAANGIWIAAELYQDHLTYLFAFQYVCGEPEVVAVLRLAMSGSLCMSAKFFRLSRWERKLAPLRMSYYNPVQRYLTHGDTERRESRCPFWNISVKSVSSSSRPLCWERSNPRVPHATARSSNDCCQCLPWSARAIALRTMNRLGPAAPVVTLAVQGPVHWISLCV